MQKRWLLVLFLFPLLLWAAVKDGVVTVAVAGTRQPLIATRTPAVWITVQCHPDNTGDCYVGGSTIADGRGVELAPGDSHHFPTMGEFRDYYDLSQIYADVAVNGNRLLYVYAQRIP